MTPRQPYQTLASASQLEIDPIKGSRFIAHLFPIQSEADVKARLAELWAQHPHARHCCWAMNTHAHARGDDDGEPKGSAGKPILAQLQGAALFDVSLVVVRYFGGTKLGVGGLVRAYSQAAGDIIKHANAITVTPKTDLTLVYRYDETSAVNAVLAQFDTETKATDYATDITHTVAIIDAHVAAFRLALTERTAGRIKIK